MKLSERFPLLAFTFHSWAAKNPASGSFTEGRVVLLAR